MDKENVNTKLELQYTSCQSFSCQSVIMRVKKHAWHPLTGQIERLAVASSQNMLEGKQMGWWAMA